MSLNKRVTLNITQEILDEAIDSCRRVAADEESWEHCCPVALALDHYMESPDMEIKVDRINIYANKGECIGCSGKVARQFITSFDRYISGKSKGTRVKPKLLDVYIGKDYVKE